MEEHRLITEHTWQCMSLAELKLFLISNTYIGLDNIQSLSVFMLLHFPNKILSDINGLLQQQ